MGALLCDVRSRERIHRPEGRWRAEGQSPEKDWRGSRKKAGDAQGPGRALASVGGLPPSASSLSWSGGPCRCLTLRFAAAPVPTSLWISCKHRTGWNTEESEEIIFLPSGVGKIGVRLCCPLSPRAARPHSSSPGVHALLAVCGALRLAQRGVPHSWGVPGL